MKWEHVGSSSSPGLPVRICIHTHIYIYIAIYIYIYRYINRSYYLGQLANFEGLLSRPVPLLCEVCVCEPLWKTISIVVSAHFVRQVLLTVRNSRVMQWANLSNCLLHKVGPDNNPTLGPEDLFGSFLSLSFWKSAEIPVSKINILLVKDGQKHDNCWRSWNTWCERNHSIANSTLDQTVCSAFFGLVKKNNSKRGWLGELREEQIGKRDLLHAFLSSLI